MKKNLWVLERIVERYVKTKDDVTECYPCDTFKFILEKDTLEKIIFTNNGEIISKTKMGEDVRLRVLNCERHLRFDIV